MVALRLEPGALFLILYLWNLPLVLAGIVNRTIDDGFGDSDTLRQVTYLPTTSTVWQDASCRGCFIRPDISRAFKGTYTAATYHPQLGSTSITMKFNGTAIYVFFILANNAGDGVTTITLANFTLDGTNPELFQHVPDLTTKDIYYNQMVYSKENLVNAEHTLVISTSGVNSDVYINFDYAIYTHDDEAPLLPLPAPSSSSTTLSSQSPSTTSSLPSTSSTTISQDNPVTPPPDSGTTSAPDSGTSLPDTSDTKKSPPIGAIVGGVIGGVAFVLLLAFLLLFCRRRRGQGPHRSEAQGYIPPPRETPIASRAAIITPFDGSSRPLFPTTGGYQRKDGSGAATTETLPYHTRGTRAPLRSVTEGDHISSPNTSLRVYSTTAATSNSDGNERADPNSVETIRRARQNEIDERLRVVQQEVTHLTSDLRGEKGGYQSSARGNQETAGEEEMSMAEMREQLSVMQQQIGYLREQQRSAWAQGLSDEAPPGYTPAARNFEPTVVPPS